MDTVVRQSKAISAQNDTGYLLIGAGLAVASMILLPAIAMRIGLGPSLTGALRIALMKASSQAMANSCRPSQHLLEKK